MLQTCPLPWLVRSGVALLVMGSLIGAPAQAQDWGRLLLQGVQLMQVSQLSEAQEVSLGRQIDQHLKSRGEIRLSRDPYWVSRVNRIGQRVAASSERPHLPYTFQVVEDPAINAFATMGGFVYITTGALQAADNDDQIAAVLAHEVAHISERHGLQQLQQAATARFGAQLLGVNDNNLAALALEVGIRRPQSRENEFVADEKGLWAAYRAGFDPQGMPQFLAKLQSRGSLPDFLRTHPPVPERIARLNQLIAQHGMVSPAAQTAPLPPQGSGGSILPVGQPSQSQRTEIEILPVLPVLP
ncbi:M48 family metallopeptidase [Thermostichus vulcanus]|uniref:M48 family metalloprotease n=1 Tax=Thermostichus vulcanus str. 'Rupite' TaxID=2813851 RepID=A0ABT0CCC1_THEVL|nr:M48 family metallopeptidase [Thermostichus vulcanus]MCJ2543420.1 M48 family metalloprotease [Thermostichus vulcanus str. 'Rupite']